MARHYLFTSESVTEGHPDKICDQISDAVLDAILAQDPQGRVACETTACTGLIHVMGEITTSCYVDIDKLAREVVREIGYDRGKYMDSTQHPTYLELVPEARGFTYIVSNGNEVWTERYRRDESPAIIPTISDFLDWMQAMGFLDTYKEKWLGK